MPTTLSPLTPLTKGILLILCCSATFATLDTIAAYMRQWYPAMQVAWFRYTFHALAVLVVAVPFMGKRLFKVSRPLWQVIRGVLLLTCTLLTFTALGFMQVAEFTALAFVTPLVVTMLAGPVLKERVTPLAWVAVCTGFVGVLIVVRPGAGALGWAALLPIVMSFFNGGFQIFTRKYAAHDDPVSTLFYTGLVGAIGCSVFLPLLSISVPANWVAPQSAHLPLLVLMGLIAAAGHYLIILAFRLAPASTLAPMTYSQMAFAVFTGWLVFNKLPDSFTILGMVVIALAGLFAAWEHRRVARKVKESKDADAQLPVVSD